VGRRGLSSLSPERGIGEALTEEPAIDRQATLESRMESVEKLTKEHVAGELQALQTAGEQAVRDPVSANGRLASIEIRVESTEKLTKEKMAGELQALQTAREQAARDIAQSQSRS